jgi:hypothetical protein
MSKKQITTKDYLDNPFDGFTIPQIIDRLKDLSQKYGNDAILEIDSGYSNAEILIKYTREENDQEYTFRLQVEHYEKEQKEKLEAKQKETKAKTEREEKKLLKKLKEKYEP